jgi:hypothetical protein
VSDQAARELEYAMDVGYRTWRQTLVSRIKEAKALGNRDMVKELRNPTNRQEWAYITGWAAGREDRPELPYIARAMQIEQAVTLLWTRQVA